MTGDAEHEHAQVADREGRRRDGREDAGRGHTPVGARTGRGQKRAAEAPALDGSRDAFRIILPSPTD